MRMSTILPLLSLAILSLFTACQKDENYVEPSTKPQYAKTFPKADAALWDYLARFESEAALRGFAVNLNATTITAKIQEIAQEHVAGTCAWGSQIGHNITIDKTAHSDYLREMVLFHELGHCYLGRQHLESTFENGMCQSIMRSGTFDCFDNYNSATRSYYLDELFTPAAP